MLTPAQQRARIRNAIATTVVGVLAVLAAAGVTLLADWFVTR